MRSLIPILFLLIPCCLSAQSYNVLTIPDSIRKEARVIVREDETILEIKSPSKAIERSHSVVTVMNENGDNFGGTVCPYSKLNSVNSVSLTLFDAMGKELKHIKKKDMEDKSYTSEGNLIDDARYKEYNFY